MSTASDSNKAVANDFYQLKDPDNAEMRKATLKALDLLTSTKPETGDFEMVGEGTLKEVLQELWKMDQDDRSSDDSLPRLPSDTFPLVDADYAMPPETPLGSPRAFPRAPDSPTAFTEMTNTTTTGMRETSAICRLIRNLGWKKDFQVVDILEEPLEGVDNEAKVYSDWANERDRRRQEGNCGGF